MAKTDKEILEKYKARVKAQNEAAKENWDTVSCRLPKGTKDRIKALGLTVNGVINDCVLKFLEEQEQNNGEQVQNEPQSTESAEKVSNDKTIEQLKIVESVADKQSNSISLEETQKILNAKMEECKNVQYIEPKREERKPINNIDDTLTEQLHAIKERREKAKNNDSDECPF